MNRTRRRWPALTLAGLAWSGAAMAQTPDGQLPPALLACAGETDVDRRLECFDRETARLRDTPGSGAAAVEAPAAVPEPTSESVKAPEPATEPDAPVAESPAAASDAAATSAPVASASPTTATVEDDFGLSDPESEHISAVVTDIGHRPYGEFVVLLDNGQIWEQKHRDNRFRIDVGDEVTISEGLVSGYRLSAGGRNNSVQVERVK